MSEMSPLQAALEREEGRRYTAYPDPLTGAEPWTIGVGSTGPDVKQGTIWTDAQINSRRDSDIVKFTLEITKALPWFIRLDDARRGVLIMMAYQLGMAGLLAFKRMLIACRDGKYVEASEEMADSKWARQTPKRCKRMQWQMERGEWWRAGKDSPP